MWRLPGLLIRHPFCIWHASSVQVSTFPPRLATLCALALLAGAARLLWATPHFGPNDLAYYNDHGQVRLVGVVADEPDVRDTYQNLRLRAESLTASASGGEERAVRGTVLVRVPRYPAHAYGERLAVSGELETPPVFEEFDYCDYLARQGVYSTIRCPGIEPIEAGQGKPFWAALYAFKARGQGTIAQILPEPYAALLAAILLGVEAGIPAGDMACKIQCQFVLDLDEIPAHLTAPPVTE